MSIDRAIEVLQEEVDAFQQGTPTQPKEGSAEWFLLRAKALGLSHLKRMRQLSLHDNPAASERFYRDCSAAFKSEREEVIRE